MGHQEMGTLMLLLGVSQGILVFQKFLMWRCKKTHYPGIMCENRMRGRVLEGVSEFWRVCRIKIPNPGSCIISNTWMTHVRWKALFIFQNHSKDSSFGGSLFSPESPYLQNVCCSVKKPLVQQWTEHARNAWYFPHRKFWIPGIPVRHWGILFGEWCL